MLASIHMSVCLSTHKINGCYLCKQKQLVSPRTYQSIATSVCSACLTIMIKSFMCHWITHWIISLQGRFLSLWFTQLSNFYFYFPNIFHTWPSFYNKVKINIISNLCGMNQGSHCLGRCNTASSAGKAQVPKTKLHCVINYCAMSNPFLEISSTFCYCRVINPYCEFSVVISCTGISGSPRTVSIWRKLLYVNGGVPLFSSTILYNRSHSMNRKHLQKKATQRMGSSHSRRATLSSKYA